MEPQAATPTGAEASARADVSGSPESASINDRIKASLFPHQEEPEKPEQIAQPVQADAEPEAEPEAETEDAAEESGEEEQTAEEIQLQSIKDLAEATGLELDRLFDLDIPTKIDGKEGTARLRDLIKSHQLEGHLNSKLMAFADEKKAFETERQTKTQEYQAKAHQLDGALRIAQRLLDGEFAQVNWEELQAKDRVEFNQRSLDYQQRQAAIKHLAGLMLKDHEAAQAETDKQTQSYLAEQKQLLESKLPEWSDTAKRTKDIAEMATVLKDAYGISKEELDSIADHRQILIARDAMKWQQLQKSKPALLNKVKAAPKLLKPGAPQSRAVVEGLVAKRERDRLRSTGKVSDAKAPLRRALFNQR